jgi:putative RecB family exonuclease
MAVKLIANYSKRLGLPGYSSHQFSVSLETELVATDDVAGESRRLYALLQSNVDELIAQTGFIPPHDYGMDEPTNNPGRNGSNNGANSGNASLNGGRWKCSEKQRDLILKLVDEHELDKHEVDHLARQRFGKGVCQLGKLEASGLIDELLDTHGGGNGGRDKRGGRRGAGRGAYAHISPTAAKAYLGCSLRFYFERVTCISRPTGPALHLGKAIHAALQRFHLAMWRGEDDSPATITHHFEEVFLKERIAGLSVPLTGAMDLVRRDLTPVDFKSAAARPDAGQAAFDHELQLVAYQLMLEAATGETPPALELVYLVKTKEPKVIKVSVRPAKRQRKVRVVRMLETAVQGIAEGRFHPQPAMHCSWCQYRRECSRWVGAVESSPPPS